MTEGHVVWHVPVEEADEVLRALPEWFGDEAVLQQYLKDLHEYDTLGWRVGKKVVGLVTLRKLEAGVATIHCLAVHPDLHRRGIGRQLLMCARGYLRNEKVATLQARVPGASGPDAHHILSRQFYDSMGFEVQRAPEDEQPTGQPMLLLVASME